MKKIKVKKVNTKKRMVIEHSIKDSEPLENTSVEAYEDNDTTLDMTGWEDEFHYEDMRGLFFIQKGQFDKCGPCVTVKDGNEYDERWIGGYDPNREGTVEHYCAIDRVTFNVIYGGSSLKDALDCVKRCIVNYHNDCERYFRDVCELTNEDFYGRHYLGHGHDSNETLKRRAEEGRSWRSSPHTKRTGYAVMKTYGYAFCDLIEEAEERAVSELEEQKARRKERHKKASRRVKIKRKG